MSHRVRQVGWQKKDVIELMFRDESFCEDHRPVLRLCAEGPDVESRNQDGSAGQRTEEQCVEGLNVQGEECVRGEEGGFSKNVTRRWRVECIGDQTSTSTRRMTSYAIRLVHDSDSIPEDCAGRNTRHESVAQTREQLKEKIVRPWPWRPCQTEATKWIMSVDLVWWGTVNHATTVSVGI